MMDSYTEDESLFLDRLTMSSSRQANCPSPKLDSKHQASSGSILLISLQRRDETCFLPLSRNLLGRSVWQRLWLL